MFEIMDSYRRQYEPVPRQIPRRRVNETDYIYVLIRLLHDGKCDEDEFIHCVKRLAPVHLGDCVLMCRPNPDMQITSRTLILAEYSFDSHAKVRKWIQNEYNCEKSFAKTDRLWSMQYK